MSQRKGFKDLPCNYETTKWLLARFCVNVVSLFSQDSILLCSLNQQMCIKQISCVQITIKKINETISKKKTNTINVNLSKPSGTS